MKVQIRMSDRIVAVDVLDKMGFSDQQKTALNEIYNALQRDGIIRQSLREFANSVSIAISDFDDTLLKEYTEAFNKGYEAGILFREEIWKVEFPPNHNVNPLSRQYQRKRR